MSFRQQHQTPPSRPMRSRPGSGSGRDYVEDIGDVEDDVPKCRCPATSVRRIVRKQGVNHDRPFFTCSKKMGEQCGFFEWADKQPYGKASATASATATAHELPVMQTLGQFNSISGHFPGQDSAGSNWPMKMRPVSSSGSDSVDQAAKRQRPSPPLRFTAKLEDVDNISILLRPSYAPSVKEAVKKFSGSTVAPKKTPFGEEKVCVPVDKVSQFESYIRAHAGAELAYDVPRAVLDRLTMFHQGEHKRGEDGDVITRSLEEILPKRLCESLMQFQWYGVNYALKRGGRCLIGDDMGLGKTIQAIAIARVYITDWPLLIVCPSSLRLNWREELLRWLEADLDDDDIRVVMSGKDINLSLLRVNIISYDLVRKVPAENLRRCQCVIADESHYLKSGNAQRTKAVTPLLKRARRALLLSGTPALSRPVELYAQLNAVSPLLFPSYNEYVTRYCNARQTYWGYDVSGSSHLDELHTVLRGTVLIRRKKEEVLTQLPEKVRHVMWVETKPGPMKAVARKFKEFEEAKEAANEASTPEEANALSMRVKGIQNDLYALSADAKIDAVLEFCKDTAESGCKFIVFAHHGKMVKRLDEYVRTRLKLGLIRIDGGTPQGDRQALCKKFQADDDKYRVAVLSITAAGVGLTLTKATVVLFAELYWNPGTLLQAEDRAHRIGQRNSIFVNYLLAKKTLDETMWRTVRRKLTVVGQSLTGTAGKMEAEEGKKDSVDGEGCEREGKDIRTFFGNKKGGEGNDGNVGNDSDLEVVEPASVSLRGGINKSKGVDKAGMDNLDNMFPFALNDEASKSRTGQEIVAINGPQGAYTSASGDGSYIDADLALAQQLQEQYDAENRQ